MLLFFSVRMAMTLGTMISFSRTLLDYDSKVMKGMIPRHRHLTLGLH